MKIFINMMIMLPLLNNPLSMLLIMLMLLLMLISMNWNLEESLINFIVSMIMMNGILILFMYMTSTLPNKKFKFSMKIMFLMLLWFLIIMLIMMYKPFLSEPMYTFFQLENKMMINFIILVYTFLVLTLVATVKISNYKSTPMRKLN